MLIIAIPKSASTSLMSTIGELQSLPYNQFMLENEETPKEYAILSRYHSDIRELNQSIIHKFTSSNAIYKQHIAPTRNNLNLLEKYKKVVLLRDTDEIIEAYFRGERSNIHKPREEFQGVKDIHTWKKRAKSIGLKRELEQFKNEWLKNSENVTYVYYEDLIQNPTKVINQIERFYGLKISDKSDIKLNTDRYSRVSALKAFINKLRLLKNNLLN